MKVFHLVRYYHPHSGGNENQCSLLSEYMVTKGLQVKVITERYSGLLSKNECFNGLIINRLNSLNSFKYYLGNTFLRKILTFSPLVFKVLRRIWYYVSEYSFLINVFLTIIREKKEFDILHIHQSNWIAFWGLAAAKYCNKVSLVKDATLGGFNELKLMPFSGFMKRYLVKHATFVAISKDIMKHLLNEGISNNRIFSIPNAVKLPKETNYYNISNNDILFVGNFWQGKIKGLDVLIQAMVRVIKYNKSCKLIILGEGPQENYKNIINENNLTGNIIFLGKQAVLDYYQRCFIFVLPSRSEGMSNSLLEAMSWGMPCISTRISGSNDLIRHGENGLLVETENELAIAEAILCFFQDRNYAYNLGKEARESIKQYYVPDIVVSSYIELYKKLLEK